MNNDKVYKSVILPPEGERLIIDASIPFDSEAGSILESLERKTKRAEMKLLQVEKELKEKTEELQKIKDAIAEEVKLKAAGVIEMAKREAAAELERIKRLAEEEGKRVGRDAGYQESKEDWSRFLKQLEEILDLAKKKRDEIIKAAEEEIIRLSILIAKKVIQREVKGDHSIVVNNVKEALKRLTTKEGITVRVNLEELNVLKEHKDELLAKAKGLRTITFIEDSSIKKGGFLIESEFGSIDATIEAQLEEIERGLLKKAKEYGCQD